MAGGSGSGKSTLAAELVRRVDGAVIVELDWFYRDLGHLTVEERSLVNFDHPGALDWELCLETITELASGRAVERPVYDFTSHTRMPDRMPLGVGPVVIVEGLLALHHEAIRARSHLAVFVDLEEERRFARRLERDVQERGRTPESVQEQLCTTVRPMHEQFVEPTRAHADVLADGAGELDGEAERVLTAFRSVGRGGAGKD